MDDLRLFYLQSCMYCQKVLFFMEQNSINIALCSIRDPENYEYLVAHGGSSQVPCLFIGEKALYESDDIIAYLRERFL